MLTNIHALLYSDQTFYDLDNNLQICLASFVKEQLITSRNSLLTFSGLTCCFDVEVYSRVCWYAVTSLLGVGRAETDFKLSTKEGSETRFFLFLSYFTAMLAGL